MSTSEAVKMSVEQMCRDLLTKAIADELVSPAQSYPMDDPQRLTSGDLSGVANLLADMLKRSNTAALTAERERVASDAIGMVFELTRCVHDECDSVPHDIGLKLAAIVRRHITKALEAK